MGAFEIAALTPEALRAQPGLGWRLLSEGAAAVHVAGYWPSERARQAASAVLASREAWVTDFGGLQFCLGRAWYTHLETDRVGEYFARAPQADRAVEAALPGLQAELREALSWLCGRPVHARRGWCGAGVHVFPAGEHCARQGGEIHFDDQGLSRAQLRGRCPSASLVLMLQAPETGGALRLWDARYEGSPHPRPEQVAAEAVEVRSAPGDLVVFDSLRLHQIQPFGGALDRISATLHGADVGSGWESWF